TIIITIATTISTATSAARDKVIGSTIRNTAEMHPMGTGKQPISLAVRGLEIVLAVELEHAQPVAEPERDREPAELEHVPVEAEDLAAAAAETTREPAAAEAVIAWEVAE